MPVFLLLLLLVLVFLVLMLVLLTLWNLSYNSRGPGHGGVIIVDRVLQLEALPTNQADGMSPPQSMGPGSWRQPVAAAVPRQSAATPSLQLVHNQIATCCCASALGQAEAAMMSCWCIVCQLGHGAVCCCSNGGCSTLGEGPASP
jgi:hypothetical protein